MSPTTDDSPVAQFPLPVEILEEILKWVPPILQTNEHAMWEGYAPLLVCKNWRTVVDAAGSLWATISMDIHQWCKAATPALLKLWINKSGPARNLHINISSAFFGRPADLRPADPLSLSISRSNLETLISNLDRIESFRVVCISHREVEMILHALKLAKKLKHLDLLIPNTRETPVLQEEDVPYQRFASLRTDLDCTDIRRVAIRGWTRPYLPPTLPSLCGTRVTELTLANLPGITSSEFAALCQRLPNIESLVIYRVLFENTRWRGRLGHPKPDIWGSMLEDKIILCRLQFLNIQGPPTHRIPRAVFHCGREITTLCIELGPRGL
jgi:hypothetical protein